MVIQIKNKIKEFTDLQAWQAAYELALVVQSTSKSFPTEERYVLTSQIRRSVLSITANIAEGFGKRTYKEKVHYYFQAHGSLVETKNHLIMARGYKYINEQQFNSINVNMLDAHKLLLGLIRSTKKLESVYSKI